MWLVRFASQTSGQRESLADNLNGSTAALEGSADPLGGRSNRNRHNDILRTGVSGGLVDISIGPVEPLLQRAKGVVYRFQPRRVATSDQSGRAVRRSAVLCGDPRPKASLGRHRRSRRIARQAYELLPRCLERNSLARCPSTRMMAGDYRAIGLLEDEAIDLDTSALALAAPDHPEVRLDPYFEHLTDLTRRLVAVGRGASSSSEQGEAIAAVLAGELGYRGDRQDYEHPDNADLIRVIDRRRGLPVSLSILYVSAARRLGWSAEVLNTPGHVLLRLGPETDPLLIDPFNGGAAVSAEGLASLLRRMLGTEARPTPEHVRPMENRAVLIRLLLNQASRAEASANVAGALALYERMTAIAPDYPQPWWDRARLEAQTGDLQGARSSLSAMLEITRDVHVRNHVCAALDALSSARS